MRTKTRILLFFGVLGMLSLAAYLTVWMYGVPALDVAGARAVDYERTVASLDYITGKEKEALTRRVNAFVREQYLVGQTPGIHKMLFPLNKETVRMNTLRFSNVLQYIKDYEPGTYKYIMLVNSKNMERVVYRTNGYATMEGDEAFNEELANHWVHVDVATKPGAVQAEYFIETSEGLDMLVVTPIPALDKLQHPSGEIEGVMLARISLNLEAILSKNAEANAIFLLQPSTQKVMAMVQQNSGRIPVEFAFATKRIVYGTEGIVVASDRDDVSWITSFKHVTLGSSDGLTLVAVVDSDSALSQSKANFYRVMVLCLFLYGFIMSMVYLLASRIAREEDAVNSLNATLEERVTGKTNELRMALEELSRNEKMVALGSIVAGMSHELNTPIGNSLTVSTTLHSDTQSFKTNMAKGLTKQALEAFVDRVTRGSEMLIKSLSHAAELVTSFKQVSVDQSSENFREFELNQVVNDVVVTLSSVLRKAQCEVSYEVPDGIHMRSYPGALTQILTNLINNSIIHGFSGLERRGRMHLNVIDEESHVTIIFSDDGRGVEPDKLGRIFEPFYTTRLGQGGSGLGLSIVHTCITQKLNGTVEVRNVEPPGTGLVFTIVLPKVVELVA